VTHDRFNEGALAPDSALFYREKSRDGFSGFVGLHQNRPDGSSYPEI